MNTRFLLVVAALATGLSAQDPNVELERLRRSLGNSQAEVERLLDLRIRHDLGMTVNDDVLDTPVNVPTTPDAMAKMQKEIAEQEAVNLTLQERFRRLAGEVDRLRKDAAADASAGGIERGASVEIPAVGSAMPRTAQAGDLRSATAPSSPTAMVDHGIGVAPASSGTGLPIGSELRPVVAQIHGSEDHQRVGQTLFAAAQQLIDRAAKLRYLGQVEAATELDKRAKERLQRARDELKPVIEQKDPPYSALFCEGRCLELLFRHDERYEGLSLDRSAKEFQQREAEVRKPFLEISARDVTGGNGPGSPTLGMWGLAAQTVLEHFRWINVHAGYRPRTEIDSLTWSGERR